ncbi:MAG: hypothetical protein K8L97_05315 [Anaerolineae bacterium]|nr:hypothetical protein [Anaerolineae bacterium]
MFWLGEKRGYLTDWVTQQWVCLTGRLVDLEHDSWLDGPIGKTRGIGKHYFGELAQEQGLELLSSNPHTGLIQNFASLTPTNSNNIQTGVRQFYENTADYDLDAWSQWSGVFRPFGGLLAALFSRRLQQLNVPLSGLDTSRGITSEIIQLVDPLSGEVRYTAWLRELIGSDNVLYAGSYSVCRIPGCASMCIKVVFPLPNGNGIVIMKPEVHKDGSFSVISSGHQFGDPGFYFTVHRSAKQIYARYVRPLREHIHVYETGSGDVRANHVLTLWGLTFLKLHYRLISRQLMTVAIRRSA